MDAADDDRDRALDETARVQELLAQTEATVAELRALLAARGDK
jgi:hypothetical protein